MQATTYPLTLFYDGLCPIGRREMPSLRRRDRAARLRFEDVRADGFAVPPETTLRAPSERAYLWLARHRFALPAWLGLAASGGRARHADCNDSHCTL